MSENARKAAEGKTYDGYILYTVGCYGDIVCIDVSFRDLDNSPWFYEHLHDFMGDNGEESGWVYLFRGTYCVDRAKKFIGMFHKKTPLDVAEFVGPSDYEPGIMRGGHTWECALCHRTNFEHREDCPFSVSFSFKNDRWWWTSLCGHKYYIEKLPGRYQMCDEVGNEIVTRRRLSSVRNWIFLNQGIL